MTEYDKRINAALDALARVVEEAEAAGLTVIVRQAEMPIAGAEPVVMNSFEVYQRLL